MYMYNITLKQASVITHAVVGQFSGKRDDYKKGLFEIALAKGKILEILKPDESTGKLHSLISVNVFGIIRSIAAFRLTGSFKDYLAVGSESGRLVILEYLPDKGRFEKVHQETFGRSGCRRIVPGQYLACDSKGRAVMIGAVEKQKLVYQLNRDTQANLTISSPLEAHKANTFVFHMINVDVGYENPLFACLEIDYEDADEDPSGKAASDAKQSLTYYELDLGLNHVVRKYSEPLEDFANLLIQIPGGNDGPSGVVVCSENFITYKNFGEQPDIKCPIPRRKGETDIAERGILIACSALYKYLEGEQRKFGLFLQTELGDLFKTEFECEEEIVTEITMTYFDTIPVSVSLCTLLHSRRHIEGGLLFAAAESGNHKLYQIQQVDDQQVQAFSSKEYVNYLNDLKAPNGGAMAVEGGVEGDEDGKIFKFKPNNPDEPLRNMIVVDEIASMAPILASEVYTHLDEYRLAIASGTGQHSSLRILRHGLEIGERAVSMLPSVATGVWSVRKRCDSPFDEYIVVSFTNATLVLGVGETIEEIVDSGFLGTKRTLCCSQLGDDSLVQVHPDGIRHIHADKRVSEWRTPLKRQIVKCALNQRQVAIALSNNEILYFEMDTTGQLNEYNERKEFTGTIGCMTLGEIAPGELRSQFLAVGVDQKVCIISLDLNDCMTEITRQTFASTPESLSIAELGAGGPLAGHTGAAGGVAAAGSLGQELSRAPTLYLNVGLQNGELVRTRLDRVTGDLSEPIRRYLGSKPVSLFNVRVQGRHAALACTNKSWLVYSHQARCQLAPLSCEPFDYAAGLASEFAGEGVVAISGSTLRVLAFERLGDVYNQRLHSLEATPRRLARHPESGHIVCMCCDRLPLLAPGQGGAAGDRWRSQLVLLDGQSGGRLDRLAFESQQAALCMALATFGSPEASLHVGVASGYSLRQNRAQASHIYSYSLAGAKLQLLHRTECELAPRAMCAFQERLVVGLGRLVRVYELGKRKLLRKCDSKQVPHMVASIAAGANRLFVGDVQESFTVMKYRKEENVLSVFADDAYPRYVVSGCLLDANTVAAGDKFGNLCLLRLPEDVNDDQDDDPAGSRSLWDRGWLGGASQKFETAAVFHLGEIVTALQRTPLALGRAECLLYATVSGSLGALVPLALKEEFEFFQTLEMQLRAHEAPLAGRDHLAFCSSYFPLKNVVDGDLCERYLALDAKTQHKIADEMDRQPADIALQIDQMLERII